MVAREKIDAVQMLLSAVANGPYIGESDCRIQAESTGKDLSIQINVKWDYFGKVDEGQFGHLFDLFDLGDDQ